MFRRIACAGLVLFVFSASTSAADPETTVLLATNVLEDVMNTPGKAIPAMLLQNAQAVVIVPRTIKLGLIVGGQHGRGVVLMRQADGSWSAPQFVTLTGGSIGWQAGAQASDFILLFRTPESVQRFLEGKFTIGADASAAAGPVGRRVNASTDIELHSEIVSYARSKGLFAGVSLDGSVLQIDGRSNAVYYAGRELAPNSAAILVDLLGKYSGAVAVAQADPIHQRRLPPNELPQPQAAAASPPLAGEASPVEAVRRSLAAVSPQMYGLLNEPWRQYLALPAEVFDPRQPPQSGAVQESLSRFETVAREERYRSLAGQRPFQETHRLLKAYAEELSRAEGEQPRLALPPPPANDSSSRRGVKRASGIAP